MVKQKTKTPICNKCGRVLKGRVPMDAEEITCFLCYSDMGEERDTDTNWKDKR